MVAVVLTEGITVDWWAGVVSCVWDTPSEDWQFRNGARRKAGAFLAVHYLGVASRDKIGVLYADHRAGANETTAGVDAL